MKKIIAAFAITLAFTFSANAQEKKQEVKTEVTGKSLISPEVAAKNDVTDLAKIADLRDAKHADLFRLFEKKHKMLQSGTLSEERINALAQTIEAKLRASLTAEEMAKLDKEPALLRKLTR